MKIKSSPGDRAFDICNVLFMIFLMVVMVYPLLNVLAISLSSPEMITAGAVTIFPREFNMKGYAYIVKDKQLYQGYLNTILYASVGCVLTLTLSSLAAYTLAVSDFVLKKFFTIFLSITMFFGGGLIPTYLLIKNLKMLNTFWVMVLPGCVGAYTVFVFRSFFQGLPPSLRESAFIDGAHDFKIWYKITLPLSKPILATYALFTIVNHWNSWFSALIYLKDASRYPLQMYLRKMIVDGEVGTTYAGSEVNDLLSMGLVNPKNLQMAVVILTVLPILCVYPFVQKYFVKGVMIGAIKG